jgi:hypothetical protein
MLNSIFPEITEMGEPGRGLIINPGQRRTGSISKRRMLPLRVLFLHFKELCTTNRTAVFFLQSIFDIRIPFAILIAIDLMSRINHDPIFKFQSDPA